MNIFKKNKKIILGIVIGIVIGISMTVSAATLIASNDVTYSNSNGNATDVKGALDELYTNYTSLFDKGTASSGDILAGKTALVKGKEISGAMENKGVLNWSPTESNSYTVPAGYYSGGTLDSSKAYSAGYQAGLNAGKGAATVVVTVYGVGGSSSVVGSRTYSLTYPSGGNYRQGDGDTIVNISWK